MAKVLAMKRTKNRCNELIKLYKDNKEKDTLPNNDDPVNDEDDDAGFESDNWIVPQKNYEDKKYITNKQLELVLQFFLKKIQSVILVLQKLGLSKRNMFILFIVYVVKFTNHGLRKKTYYASQKRIQEKQSYVTKQKMHAKL